MMGCHRVGRVEASLGKQAILKSVNFFLYGATEDAKAVEKQKSELAQ